MSNLLHDNARNKQSKNVGIYLRSVNKWEQYSSYTHSTLHTISTEQLLGNFYIMHPGRKHVNQLSEMDTEGVSSFRLLTV
jgi:hypothetical protein